MEINDLKSKKLELEINLTIQNPAKRHKKAPENESPELFPIVKK